MLNGNFRENLSVCRLSGAMVYFRQVTSERKLIDYLRISTYNTIICTCNLISFQNWTKNYWFQKCRISSIGDIKIIWKTPRALTKCAPKCHHVFSNDSIAAANKRSLFYQLPHNQLGFWSDFLPKSLIFASILIDKLLVGEYSSGALSKCAIHSSKTLINVRVIRTITS